MKLFSLVVVALVGMNLLVPSAAFTELERPVKIKSIVHTRNSEVKETVTFTLDTFVVPRIFTYGGAKPRLVIDFPESIYLGKNIIPLADGVLASAIRTGLHKTPVKKTRAVVDLSKEMPVQYTSKYSELDNTLIVTLLTSDGTKEKTTGGLQAKSKIIPPSKKKPLAKPFDNKSVPLVATTKKFAVEPASEKTTTPDVPTILDISFDDSSSKGEMVLFRLNEFSPPVVSVIEKDKPRVLCDFMDMNMGPSVEKNILANSKYVERIRTAKHTDPKKVRVVLDLVPSRDYDLQQVFFRNDNLFVLIVNELTPDQENQ